MPLDVDYLQGLVMEAFDPGRHDRIAFSCGQEKLDNFFKVTAGRYVREDSGRIYVAVERAGPRVVGYYAVGPHAIDLSSFDEATRKRFPRSWDRVPAYMLSMFAVDRSVQGRGVARFMAADLFHRCLAASEIVGGRFLVLDAINERAKRTYQRLGFEPLVSQPDRMLISIARLRRNASEARKIG